MARISSSEEIIEQTISLMNLENEPRSKFSAKWLKTIKMANTLRLNLYFYRRDLVPLSDRVAAILNKGA